MSDQQNPRPVPIDPDRELVVSILNIDGEEWWLTEPGDHQAMAVEAMRLDGADWQRVVAFELPVRKNNGTDHKVLRVMMSPEDALGFAKVLTHTARWLEAAAARDPFDK